MDIQGKNKCFVCGYNINWQARIKIPTNTAYNIDGTKAQAEAVANGRTTATNGSKVQYEITVECPHCKNKNKFEV